jgi:L-iditol 2-dehydrogenase
MKAAIINAPGDFGVYEVEKPACPIGGMLVKVLAVGLCGGDLRTLRMGHHRVKLPFIVGHEISGEVVKPGPDYSGPWKTGDKLAIAPVVYCGKCEFCEKGIFELCNDYKELAQHWPGGFAEYMAIPEEAVLRGTIREIPLGLDPVHATLVEPLSSCVNAQEKGNTGPGDTVAIIGAGPVGTLHLELARARGAKMVIVADTDDNRLDLIKSYNPDYLINSAKINLVEKVCEITNGYGADVVITANPVPETQIQAVEMAKKGGRILLFGGLPIDKSKPGIDMNLVHYNALHLIGTTIFAPEHNLIAMDLVASGKISAEKFISHVMPLSEFVEGAKLALEGKARKVVFVP